MNTICIDSIIKLKYKTLEVVNSSYPVYYHYDEESGTYIIPEFFWEGGNFACDCNRRSILLRFDDNEDCGYDIRIRSIEPTTAMIEGIVVQPLFLNEF